MSLVLNGSTQYAFILEAIALGRPLTIAGWLKSDSASAAQAIASLANKDAEFDYRVLGLRGDLAGDPIVAQERDSSPNYKEAETTTGYSTSVWYHALAEFNSATLRKALIGGGGEGQETSSVTPSNLDKTAIGVICRNTLAWFFEGKLAEIAVWNVVLTDQEKTDLAAGASPSDIRFGSLIAHWKLVNNYFDSSGNGNTLTGVASPTFDSNDHPTITISQTGWPQGRPNNYNPYLYWDEESETWGSGRVTIPGVFAEYLVAVGEEGEVYFGEV